MGPEYCSGDRCDSSPFFYEGEQQIVAIVDDQQTLQRIRCATGEILDQVVCPVTPHGCEIEEIAASPSGRWLVTRRNSGQSEWGYDVFRTRPLEREAGVFEEAGYLLELPKFSADESFLVGGAGTGFLGAWWAWADESIEELARRGSVDVGFLFVHDLPSHKVTRHILRVNLPNGWEPDGPSEEWHGPTGIAPTARGVTLTPCGSESIELLMPLPRIITLPLSYSSPGGA
jgi:hypothetical protein